MRESCRAPLASQHAVPQTAGASHRVRGNGPGSAVTGSWRWTSRAFRTRHLRLGVISRRPAGHGGGEDCAGEIPETSGV